MQASWIGVLLDVGQMRKRIEDESRKSSLSYYGEDKHDDLHDYERYRSMMDLIYTQHVRDPSSWSKLLSYTANTALFSEDRRELRGNLLRLATIVVAWIEDIDRRDDADRKVS